MVSKRTINQFHRLFKPSVYKKDFKNIFKLFQGIYGIDLLPEKVLKIMNSFNRCDLLVHQRGQINAIAYHSSSEQSSLKAKNFRTVYSQIKKGKKGYFQVDADLAKILKMTGFYTGSVFSGSFFDVILVLTRQEFFPPEEEEILQLKELNQILPHFIEKFLLLQENYKKNEELINFFNHFPSSIYIENQIGEILFRSEVYKQSQKLDSTFKLHKINNIYTYIDKDKVHTHTAEMFHQERVILLGELLNTLRHELSNPLLGLEMSSQIVYDSLDDSELSPLIKEMKKSVNRCQKILNNFSDLYSDTNQKQDIDLNSIIQETIILTKSVNKGIFITYENTNLITINSNPTWVLQILFNLILNSSQALKATSRPQIEIEMEEAQDFIHLYVKDNGPGVSSDNQKKLFKNFYTTKKEGTGLGLAISQNLARRMGGDLTLIESKPNIKTIFKFTLARSSKC